MNSSVLCYQYFEIELNAIFIMQLLDTKFSPNNIWKCTKMTALLSNDRYALLLTL